MSYYDDASLVLIPSGVKAAKVYSQKPTDGSGDLTFSRASTATRTNASGAIETVSSNVPRLDYSGGATCPRLLLEPQRTNRLLQSNNFNTTWAFSGTGTVTQGATDPFGGTTAWTLNKTAANTFIFQSTVGFSGSNTFSVYAKAGTVNQLYFLHTQTVAFNAFFDLIGGTVVSSSNCVAAIISVGGGWFRCSISATVAGPSNIRIYPAMAGSVAGTTGNILIYAAQGEDGAYPTTYIPTTTAAVTRIADAFLKTGISSLIGQTQGTLFLELIANRTGINQNIELGDGTTNNRITLRFTLGNTYQLIIVQAGAVVYNQSSVTTFAQSQRIKIAAAYKSGDVTQLYVNGTSVASATAGTITGNFSAIYSSSNGGTADPIFSPINQAALFPTRLTNAELATLTTL